MESLTAAGKQTFRERLAGVLSWLLQRKPRAGSCCRLTCNSRVVWIQNGDEGGSRIEKRVKDGYVAMVFML